MSRVSVLMPVHNAAPFVGQAVQSILAQTFRDFELVIVDDGSTDGTGDILAAMADGDKRIKILPLNANQGIVGALNAGLEMCSGEFLARMDADDIARADRLSRQIEFMEANPDHAACGCDLIFFGASHWYARYPRSDQECKSLLALYPCLPHNGVTIRREMLNGIQYRAEYRLAEDYRLWLDLAVKGKFANLPLPLMRYRIHSQQSSSSLHAQRRLHGRIAAESLARIGLGTFDASDVVHFMWPRMDSPTLDRRAYSRHALHLMRALWHMNEGQCRWLRARLLRVALKNLVL